VGKEAAVAAPPPSRGGEKRGRKRGIRSHYFSTRNIRKKKRATGTRGPLITEFSWEKKGRKRRTRLNPRQGEKKRECPRSTTNMTGKKKEEEDEKKRKKIKQSFSLCKILKGGGGAAVIDAVLSGGGGEKRGREKEEKRTRSSLGPCREVSKIVGVLSKKKRGREGEEKAFGFQKRKERKKKVVVLDLFYKKERGDDKNCKTLKRPFLEGKKKGGGEGYSSG